MPKDKKFVKKIDREKARPNKTLVCYSFFTLWSFVYEVTQPHDIAM